MCLDVLWWVVQQYCHHLNNSVRVCVKVRKHSIWTSEKNRMAAFQASLVTKIDLTLHCSQNLNKQSCSMLTAMLQKGYLSLFLYFLTILGQTSLWSWLTSQFQSWLGDTSHRGWDPHSCCLNSHIFLDIKLPTSCQSDLHRCCLNSLFHWNPSFPNAPWCWNIYLHLCHFLGFLCR